MIWSSLNAFWEWLSSTWETVLPRPVIVFPNQPADNEVFGRFIWVPFYPTISEYESGLASGYSFSQFNEDNANLSFSEFSRSILNDLPDYARGRWDFN